MKFGDFRPLGDVDRGDKEIDPPWLIEAVTPVEWEIDIAGRFDGIELIPPVMIDPMTGNKAENIRLRLKLRNIASLYLR